MRAPSLVCTVFLASGCHLALGELEYLGPPDGAIASASDAEHATAPDGAEPGPADGGAAPDAAQPGMDASAGGPDSGQPGADASTAGPDAGHAAGSVTGWVFDQYGTPIEGARVLIGSSIDTTDSNGEFTILYVAAGPYTATAVIDKRVFVFEGLTRTNPTLWCLDYSHGTQYGSNVFGNITGPAPATRKTHVSLSASPAWAELATDEPSSTYDGNVNWKGPASFTGILRALRWETDASGPTKYVGYGAQSVNIIGGYPTAPAIGLEPLSDAQTSHVLGTSSPPPAGYTFRERRLGIWLDSDVMYPALDGYALTPQFNYPAPELPQARYTLRQQAAPAVAGERSNTVKAGIVPGNTTPYILETMVPPVIGGPAPNDPNVTVLTDFVWLPSAGAVYVLTCLASNQTTMPSFTIVTSASTTRLPNLPGFELPSNARYDWTLQKFTPISIDEVAGPKGRGLSRDLLFADFDISMSAPAPRIFYTPR